MAAFVISTSLKQSSSRRIIENIIKNSHFRKQKTNILATTCIQSRWYLTTPVYFKRRKLTEEKSLQCSSHQHKMKQKNLVIEIWKDMTVIDLAISAHQSIDNIYEVLSYIDDTCHYKPYSVIEDMELVLQVVKKLRAKYRIISSPKKKKVHNVEKKDHDAVKRPLPKPEELIKRHPIITVMGHVDHGKTTLLDALRNTSVVKTEFGGITQHIGAFNVTLDSGEKVTFLDTPGHAAFNAMRARGANVTDIVVLVVAADDGVMDQTVESIEMARNANVPIIVAINKIDKRGADIERAQKMLMHHGIQVEDLGGNVQSVNVSAIKGTNLKALVEAINTQAELMNLRGDPSGLVEGVVIEASNNAKYGKVATVLIQRGTLRPKAILVSGLTWAKARCMFDHLDNLVPEAKLSEAVRVIGWRELPSAGDEVLQVENERKAHSVIKVRESKEKELMSIKQLEVATKKHEEHLVEYKVLLAKKRLLGKHRLKREGPMPKEKPIDDTPKVNVLIKGDVVGSVEAILGVIGTYSKNDQCQLNVVYSGVGPVTETEIMIAEAFDAIVYCFNVDTSKKIEEIAEENKVPIRLHNVIYRLIDDIKLEINNKLPLMHEEEVLGEANVLQQFVVSKGRKKWNVAGCRCYKGTLSKTAMYRLMRNDKEIFRGPLDSMRHLKEEMNTIQNGQDCGLKFKDPEVSFEPGDVLVCYKLNEKMPETDWDPGF